MLHRTVGEFIEEMEENVFYRKLHDQAQGYGIGPQESYSAVSVMLARIVAKNEKFKDVDLLFEYNPPLYSGYCDLIVIGQNDHVPCAYFVELKHWKNRPCIPGISEGYINYNGQNQLHPSAQIREYARYCVMCHEAFVTHTGSMSVKAGVFFTAMDDKNTTTFMHHPFEKLVIDYPIFNHADSFAKSLQSAISESDHDFANMVIKGNYMQNRDLQIVMKNVLHDYLQSNQPHPFTLLGAQDRAYRQIADAMSEAMHDRSPKKKVFVIQGKPGSGKTAVALNLLVEALRIGCQAIDRNNVGREPAIPHRHILFTTSNTNVEAWEAVFGDAKNLLMRKKIFNPGINGNNSTAAVRWCHQHHPEVLYQDGHTYRFDVRNWRDTFSLLKAGEIKLLKENGDIEPCSCKLDNNMFFLSIVDEAHSLISPYDEKAQKPVMYNTPVEWFKNIGPQAYYIMFANKISVFLMEEAQGFLDRETTRISDIKRWAEELDADYEYFELEQQFRCGGSTQYIEWVDKLFSDSPVKNHDTWQHQFSLQVVNTPEEMEQKIREQLDKHATARLISSDSIEWRSQRDNTAIDFDASNTGGTTFAKRWNTPKKFIMVHENPAMQHDPLCEIGYPEEVRGWDFDYLGQLWLDDVVWRSGQWQINLEHIYDNALKSSRAAAMASIPKGQTMIHKGMNAAVDKLCDMMFHIYRVLLTRALEGHVLYVKDKATREHVRELLA